MTRVPTHEQGGGVIDINKAGPERLEELCNALAGLLASPIEGANKFHCVGVEFVQVNISAPLITETGQVILGIGRPALDAGKATNELCSKDATLIVGRVQDPEPGDGFVASIQFDQAREVEVRDEDMETKVASLPGLTGLVLETTDSGVIIYGYSDNYKIELPNDPLLGAKLAGTFAIVACLRTQRIHKT